MSQIQSQNSFNQSQLTSCHNQFQLSNSFYYSVPNFDHPQFSQAIFGQSMYNPNDVSFQPTFPIYPTFNYPINSSPQQIKPSCVYIDPLFIARNELTDINQNSGANGDFKQDTSKDMAIQNYNKDGKDLNVVEPIKASVKHRSQKSRQELDLLLDKCLATELIYESEVKAKPEGSNGLIKDL